MNNFYKDLAASLSGKVGKAVSVIWTESAVRSLKKNMQLDGLTFDELSERLATEWLEEFE